MTRSAAPRVSACTKIRSGPRAAVAMVRPPATLPTSVLVRIETSWPGDLTVSLGPGARGREPRNRSSGHRPGSSTNGPLHPLLTAGATALRSGAPLCQGKGEKNGPVGNIRGIDVRLADAAELLPVPPPLHSLGLGGAGGAGVGGGVEEHPAGEDPALDGHRGVSVVLRGQRALGGLRVAGLGSSASR